MDGKCEQSRFKFVVSHFFLAPNSSVVNWTTLEDYFIFASHSHYIHSFGMLRLILFVLLLSLVSPLRTTFQNKFIHGRSISLKAEGKIDLTTVPSSGSNIYNINSISGREKKKYSDFAKFIAWGCSSVFIKSKPVSAVTSTIFPECSESITVFRKGDREAVVIGTAHISEESAKLVERTIQTLHPSIVMIELDPKRIGKFSNLTSLSLAGFDVPSFAMEGYSQQTAALEKLSQRKPNLFDTVINGIRSAVGQVAQGVSGAVLGRFLSQFYKSFEKLGFQTGAEFKVAVVEGQRQGARILLGDRDVDITLQRLSSAISGSDPDSFDRLLSKMEGMDVFASRSEGAAETLKGFQGDMDKVC